MYLGMSTILAFHKYYNIYYGITQIEKWFIKNFANEWSKYVKKIFINFNFSENGWGSSQIRRTDRRAVQGPMFVRRQRVQGVRRFQGC